MDRKIGVLIFFCCMSVCKLGTSQNSGLQIYIFNVGQTDAQLIVGPERTLLIDTGAQVAGPKKQYEHIAQKIEEITGGKTVDYFLISHYHYDHMGSLYHNSPLGNGLWGLFREGIKIETVVDRGDDFSFSPTTGSYDNYTAARAAWENQGFIGSRLIAVQGNNTAIALGAGVTVEVVAVNSNGVLQTNNTKYPGRFANFPPSENDYSIALKISLGDFEYFTGGDLSGVDATNTYQDGGTSSYNDVETVVANFIGDVEILKASHHGSGHSSNDTFVSVLDPELSIISCGQNTYGHPSPVVFGRLHGTGSILITSGIADSVAQTDPGILNYVVGEDIVIDVNTDGSYTVLGQTFQSYSDQEEADQNDANATYPVMANLDIVPSPGPVPMPINLEIAPDVIAQPDITSTETAGPIAATVPGRLLVPSTILPPTRTAVDIVNLLMNAGTDINTKDGNGNTALIIAAQMCQTNVVQMLISKGADVNVKNNAGENALMVALRACSN